MNPQDLIRSAQVISVIVEGSSWQLDELVDKVVDSGDWDLVGHLLVSASEISARQMATKLVAKEAYEPLAVAGCLRRQPRRPGEGAVGGGGGVSRRIFRDVDAEDDGKGVPEHIRADIEDMSSTADATRASAMSREAAIDRDPIRQYIVDSIAPRLPFSEDAMNALVAIARASAWEETRRAAALKLANEPISVNRMAAALRTEDIVDIARTALLGRVSETFAREMGKYFQAYADKKDATALDFIAEHHPDQRFKDSARQWADAVRRG
jgi:hypothetical protein